MKSRSHYWEEQMPYHIRSRLNGSMLDVRGGIAVPGTRVQTFPENIPPSNNQLWTITNDGHIISQLGQNLVLDVEGGVLNPQTPVQIFPQNQPPSPNQLWTITWDGYIITRLTNDLNHPFVLDIEGANQNPGANVQIFP